MTIANLDSSIPFKRFDEIDFPISSFSPSLKVTMPLLSKASYRGFVKLLRVSLSPKLRKTSYFHCGVEEEIDDEDEAFLMLMEAIGNILADLEPK